MIIIYERWPVFMKPLLKRLGITTMVLTQLFSVTPLPLSAQESEVDQPPVAEQPSTTEDAPSADSSVSEVPESSQTESLSEGGSSETSVSDNSLHDLLINHSPLTEADWNKIDQNYWQKFDASASAETIFKQVFQDHAWIFTPNIAAMRQTLKNDYNVEASKLEQYSNLDLLYLAYHNGVQDITSEKFASLVNVLNVSTNASNTSSPTLEKLPESTFQSLQSRLIDQLRQLGVSSSQIEELPISMYRNVISEYLLHSQVGDGPGALVKLWFQMYPDTFGGKFDPEALALNGKTAKENVEEFAKAFESQLYDALKNYGITDEMFARIPKDAVYQTLIQIGLRNQFRGDIGTAVRIFKELYPEAFNQNLKPLTESERKQKIEEAIQKQEKLDDFVKAQQAMDNLPALKKDIIFKFKQGEYKIKRFFVLHPEEAGNRSKQSYMLGIQYEFKNNSQDIVNVNSEELLTNSIVTQLTEQGKRVTLAHATYELPEEAHAERNKEVVLDIAKEVKPGETIEGTLYYVVPKVEHDMALAVIQNDAIQEYKLPVKELLAQPFQSAVYTTESAVEPVHYLFDFNKLYLIYSENSSMNSWKNQPGVMTDVKEEALSLEARHQLNVLTQEKALSELMIVELADVTYEVQETNVDVKHQEKVIWQWKMSEDGKTLSTPSQNVYHLIPFKR